MPTRLSAQRRIESLLRRGLPSRYPPIVVASFGRAGSTMVHDSLCRAMAMARFWRPQGLGHRIVSDYAWDLRDTRLHNGVVYKTHALAHELPVSSRARVIFLFGLASDTVISVLSCRQRYGREWIQAHFEHMRASGTLADLPERDVLRLEEQLDGWLSETRHPVLALRYETLWDHIGVLSDFVGFPVTLPRRRPRESAVAIGDATVEVVHRTYAALDERITALPDYVLI